MFFLLSNIFSVFVSLLILFIDWRWGHILIEKIFWFDRITIVVTDNNVPVNDAVVIVSGSGVKRTNEKGEVKFYIPREDIYGLNVRYQSFACGSYMHVFKPKGRYSFSDKGLVGI